METQFRDVKRDVRECVNFWGVGVLTLFPLQSKDTQEKAAFLLTFMKKQLEGILSAYLKEDIKPRKESG